MPLVAPGGIGRGRGRGLREKSRAHSVAQGSEKARRGGEKRLHATQVK